MTEQKILLKCKRFYLTSRQTDKLWNYVGDPLNAHTTFDVGLISVPDVSEIRVDIFGPYVERLVKE